MGAKSHKRYLEERALREAQKAIDRYGRGGLQKENFAALRIQTIEPWKRISLGVVGGLFVGGGFYALKEGDIGFAVVFLMIGALCLLAAVFGRKKTIEAALDGLGFLHALDAF